MNANQIIRRPLVTEKSTILREDDTVIAFEVAPGANKIQVKSAVEELFKVKVQEASPHSARDAGGLFTERVPGLEHVQTIGRTVILYRAHPETPEIRLPK